MEHPHRLAEAETYIIHVLKTADPRQEASGYSVTARECHERSKSWNHQDLEADTLEEAPDPTHLDLLTTPAPHEKRT